MTRDLGIFIPGGKIGILLLHDLGGSALDMRSMAQGFARAGYSVCTPRLSEHPGGAGWNSATAFMEAEQAIMRLKAQCTDVIALGQGYGAMLALEIARQNAGIVQALVLLEPRSSVLPLAGTLTAALARLLPQTWLARVIAWTLRSPSMTLQAPALGFVGVGTATSGGTTGTVVGLPGAVLIDLAQLLDSAQSGLASVTQPSLLFHGRAQRGKGGSSILLQRRLAGRVESVMVDDELDDEFDGSGVGRTAAHDHVVDGIVERSARFVATVLEENETKRGNQLRRERIASRSNAA